MSVNNYQSLPRYGYPLRFRSATLSILRKIRVAGLLAMPRMRFEWVWTPQTIFSAITALSIIIGLVGMFFKVQHDIDQAKNDVRELKIAQNALLQSNIMSIERLSKVETMVQMMLPSLRRIEDHQIRELAPAR